MIMTEYIERKIALSIREPSKSDRHYQTYNLDDAYEQGWDDALCCIETIPVADVAPVRHGRWLCVDTDTEQFFLCNRCKKKEYWESNYCPNCGCRMDGGDSDAAD